MHHRPSPDLPHYFQNRQKVLLQCFSVTQSRLVRIKRRYVSDELWAQLQLYRGILQSCPGHSGYFLSCPKFLCSVHLNNLKCLQLCQYSFPIIISLYLCIPVLLKCWICFHLLMMFKNTN
jgi:hypothetical protein